MQMMAGERAFAGAEEWAELVDFFVFTYTYEIVYSVNS